MINNTFFIVAREDDEEKWINNPNRDRWGWEFVDNIELFDYKEALALLKEYQAAMPHHVVRLRAVPIDKTRHDYRTYMRPKV